MRKSTSAVLLGVAAGLSFGPWPVASAVPQATRSFALDSPTAVETRATVATAATHMGRAGLRLVETAGNTPAHALAVVRDSDLLDGVVELELAGRPLPGSPDGSRGFVGLAFRVQPDGQYEAFYLRPTNGRADDQLRRNHSTQYISNPGFPWHRLRAESPGVYESYVDLVTGEWTSVRIEFAGTQARLFVHGSAQPSLIVNDLKQTPKAGPVALWIGQGTEAFFRNLRITSRSNASARD